MDYIKIHLQISSVKRTMYAKDQVCLVGEYDIWYTSQILYICYGFQYDRITLILWKGRTTDNVLSSAFGYLITIIIAEIRRIGCVDQITLHALTF